MIAAAPTASTLVLDLNVSAIERQSSAKATLMQLVSDEAQLHEEMLRYRQSEGKDWLD